MRPRIAIAAILAMTHAHDLDFLIAERARCESAGDRELCSPVEYVQLLVELGDAHLEQEQRDMAAEVYELAAMDSFETLGKDSRDHSTALLRLASARLYVGEYQKAHSLLSGWLNTHRSGWNYLGTDAERLEAELDELDALAKQAEAAALGGMFALAKAPLEALLTRVMEGGAVAEHLGMSRHARAHLLLAGVLPNLAGADLGDLTRRDLLERAAAHADKALEIHQDFVPMSTDDGALNAGVGARRREIARDGGPGRQVEMSMCANLKAVLLHELKAPGASAAAQEALKIQTAAADAIGVDMAATAEALKRAKGDLKVLQQSMAAIGMAMHEGFRAHLQAEGRTEAAAARLASFFGQAPDEAAEQLDGEEIDEDQSAMESALKSEM